MAISMNNYPGGFMPNRSMLHTEVNIQYRNAYLTMRFPLTGNSRQDADQACREIYRAIREFPGGYPWQGTPPQNQQNNVASNDDEDDDEEIVPRSDSAKRLGDTFE